MKKLYLFLSFACISFFSACSSDDNPLVDEIEQIPQEEKITFGVGMPGSDGTRVNTDLITDMYWEKGDVLIAIGYNQNQAIIGTSEFTLSSGEGGTVANFTGNAIKDAVYYSFVYKTKNASLKTSMWEYQIQCDYLSQIQNGVSTTSHIKDCLILAAPMINPSTQGKNVTMNLKNSVIRFNIQNLPAELQDADKYVISTYNDFYGLSNTSKVNYNGQLVAKQDNFVYVAFDPTVSLPGNGDFIVEIEANQKVAKAKRHIKNNKYFDPGKIYTILIDYATPGVWTWEAPAPKVDVVYEADFQNDPEWVEENGDLNLDLWKVFSYYDEYDKVDVYQLRFNDGGKVIPTDRTEPVDTRVISPAFDLKSSNILTFEYYLNGYDSYNQDINELYRSKTRVYIRETGTETWTELSDFKGFGTDYYGWGGYTSSGDISIPETFNGKNVQLSFTFYSTPYVDWSGTATGSQASIWNIVVKGC